MKFIDAAKAVACVVWGGGMMLRGVIGLVRGTTVVDCSAVNCGGGPEKYIVGGWEGVFAGLGYLVMGFSFIYVAYLFLRNAQWEIDSWGVLFTLGLLIWLAGVLSYWV